MNRIVAIQFCKRNGHGKDETRLPIAVSRFDKEVADVIPPSEHDPFIEPGWRHLRAIRLVAEGKKANHPRDDDASTQAWLFYRFLQHCTTKTLQKALAQKMPAHYQARELFATGHSNHKAEIEARFLAGQDDETIATRFGMSQESVDVYHELYFDVRGRLDDEHWISNLAIGSRMPGRLRTQDRDLIVKLVGYQFGHIILDALLGFYSQPPLILREVKRLAPHELLPLADKLRIQAFLLALTLQNRRSDRRAATLMHDLLARVRTAEENVDQQAPTLRLMDETVLQRLETADTPLTEGNPIVQSGPLLRPKAPMAMAA